MLRSLSHGRLAALRTLSRDGRNLSNLFLRGITSSSQPQQQGSFSQFKIPETDLRLREDVRTLGAILGSFIKCHDPEVFEAVEKLRKLGKQVSEFANVHVYLIQWAANLILSCVLSCSLNSGGSLRLQAKLSMRWSQQ